MQQSCPICSRQTGSNSHLPRAAVTIEITGERVRYDSDVVLINGRRASMGLTDFERFMLLVVERKNGGDGYVETETVLKSTTKGNAESTYQVVGRLRQAVGQALEEDLLRKYIIDTNKPGCVRLRVPSNCIRCDKQALRKHRSPRVRELAEQLPDDPESVC